jgi:hypothetical protein
MQKRGMKKTFRLSEPGKETPRVIDAIKCEVNKYLKRERRKKLPEGVDFWDFNCQIGADQETPVKKHVAELGKAIDAVAAAGATAVFVEILATPGHRTKRVPEPEAGEADSDRAFD